MTRPTPRVDGFDPGVVRRMQTTVSCPDCDDIPKVEHAGEIHDQDGQRVQTMHNGVLVEAGGYHGDWMAEIIRTLRGHHEPQEELVFHRLIERLQADGDSPTMIEFGSFWSYYSLWFCHAFPHSRVVALEPDPKNLELGRRNADLNGYSDRIQFVHAAIGDHPGETIRLATESDWQERDVLAHDLASLMAAGNLNYVDLILSDVQGAETILLDRARGDFAAGRVRFLMVSTHHHEITDNPLSHQQALAVLQEAGAHVIAEHSVGESFSGDGLIAVSFDERDRDLLVPVSHARSRDSIFGELEFDVARAREQTALAQHQAAQAQEEIAGLQSELAQTRAERAELQHRLLALTQSKLWRVAERPRAVYAALYSKVRQHIAARH